MPHQLHIGNSLDILPTLPEQSAQCCVTSPPYWGLRDYGDPGQEWPAVEFRVSLGGLDVPVSIPAMTAPLGLEPTPIAFVGHLVAIFREVRRVLADDGVMWVNIGDTYAQNGSGPGQGSISLQAQKTAGLNVSTTADGIKPKDLIGIPWLLAYALRSDGWYLRSDVIWHKRNPMPESVTDRPTKGHEYVFLLAKSARYFYDADALSEPATHAGATLGVQRGRGRARAMGVLPSGNEADDAPIKYLGKTRNIRTVWSISSQPYPGSHFAVMPPELARRCVVSASRPGGVVLDPFAGAATTGKVAIEQGRDFVGIELMPENAVLARARLDKASERVGKVTAETAKPGQQLGFL